MKLRSGTAIPSGEQATLDNDSRLDIEFWDEFNHAYIQFDLKLHTSDANKRIMAAVDILTFLNQERYQPVVLHEANKELLNDISHMCNAYNEQANQYYSQQQITKQTYDKIKNKIYETEQIYN